MDGWLQCWLAGYWLRVHLFTMSLTYTTANILCTATDVGMHGLLAIVNRVTILCYPLVWVHCWPVADFFIANRHPYILLISLEIFFIFHYFVCKFHNCFVRVRMHGCTFHSHGYMYNLCLYYVKTILICTHIHTHTHIGMYHSALRLNILQVRVVHSPSQVQPV